VVVCEQHEVTGGGAHTFAVGGESSKYRFNAGHHLSIPLHEYLLQLTCGSDIPPVPFSVLKDSDGANDRVVFGCKPSDEVPLPIKDDVWVLNELCRRFPEQQKDIKKYFSLAETVQLRFALLIGSALLPQFLQGLFLRSPMMSIWRLWAGKTTADGLKEILPGEDEASRKLRSYAIGLWLDVGSPPARSSFFMQTAVFGGMYNVHS
jgi:phytoene dehydrogenase-like protein